MRNLPIIVLLTGAVLGGSACAARPIVPQTQLAIPAQLASPLLSEAAFEADWWRQFDDEVLNSLIEDAMNANRDLAAAAARVVAARELAGAARTAHLPGGGVAAGAGRQHLSAHEAGGDVANRTFSTLDTQLRVSWEADVFGRIRSASRAAAADAQATEHDARMIQVAVVAEVAGSYFQLRGAQRELALIADLRTRARAGIRVMSAQVEAGRTTRLDLLRAQQIEQELSIEEADVTRARDVAIYRLATLTARTHPQWTVPDSTPRELRATPLAIGRPLEMLKRRPDVASADVRVVAAAARAGISRAALYPRIDIGGSVGLVAGSVGRLGEAAAGSWLVAPRIAWAFLDWPQLRRRARAADALTEAAFAEYEQTLLRALEETRAGIASYAAATDRLRAASERAEAAESALTMVTAQYREGLVDSLSRTLAERDAIAARLTAAQAVTQHRLAVVDLYRALGGGWR